MICRLSCKQKIYHIFSVDNLPSFDNISCVKTFTDKASNDAKTVFGTYDGRINYVSLYQSSN